MTAGGGGGGGGATGLRVRVDGDLLPDDDARAFWERFSAHMEAFRGDLAGFAKAEGFASVHPGIEGGRPVLVASRSSPQKAYATVPEGATSGSTSPRPAGTRGSEQGGKRRSRRR
jgi:hypothetical protein